MILKISRVFLWRVNQSIKKTESYTNILNNKTSYAKYVTTYDDFLMPDD